EDTALALGEALDRALGDRRGIARYGDAVVPMDDALARASTDLGGRAWADVRLDREPGLAQHALQSLAQAGRLALHVESTGRDEHHVAEAAVKARGPASARGGSTKLCRGGSPAAERRWASASGCNWRSIGATRTAESRGWAFSQDALSCCARGGCRGSVGRTSSPAARRTTSHTP